MKKKFIYRILAITLIIMLSVNTFHARKVEASITFSMVELLVGVGGKALTAVFGSAGMAVAAPLLIGACVIGSGYLIYKNRDVIYANFKHWKDTTSTYVKQWLDTTSTKIENGEITDNSTITIPRAVYEETKQYVNDVSKDIGVPDGVVNDSKVEFSKISSSMKNDFLKNYTAKYNILSYAPVYSIYRNDGLPNLRAYNSAIVCSAISTNNVLVFAPFGVKDSTVRYYQGFYTSEEKLLTSTNVSLTTSDVYMESQNGGSSTDKYIIKEWSAYTLDGTTVRFNDKYTMDLFIPNGAKLYITDDIVLVDSISSGTSIKFKDGLPLDLSQFDLITNENVEVRNNFDVATKVYSPKYNDADEIEFTMSPTNINALNDYIVNEKTKEYELVSTLNPDSFVDNESIPKPNILDGIVDFFTNPLVNILDFLQKIATSVAITIPSLIDKVWDAIQTIPVALNKVWESVQAIPESINKVWESIKAIPGLFVKTLQDVLEWLFVPDKVAINEYVIALENTISTRYGLLTYPLSLVIKFLNELNAVGNKDCILKIPKIEFKGYILLEEYEFNFTQYVRKSEFSEIYNYYRLLTNFILILAVVNLAMRKGSEIIRGN